MCKVGQGKTGGGVLARMRHLHGQMGENSAQSLGANSPGSAKDGVGADGLPPLPPVLRLLSADVLTEMCTLLDAESLATAAGVCRSFRDVCQGPYPWRHLCAQEWALPCEEEQEALDGLGKPAAAGAGLPRKRLQFHDSILGGDFRKLFPLIEQIPSGFDCALLRDSPANASDDANNDDDDDDDDDNDALAGGEDGAEEGAAAGDDNAGVAGADPANNNYHQAEVAPGAGPPAAPADEPDGAEEEEAEGEAGDFLIKGVQRRRTTKTTPPSSPAASSPSSPAAVSGQDDAAVAAAAPAAPAPLAAATGRSRRPRSSSGDVALQVEFRGGVGIGNRCVRADLPLPSTVLRERTGAGARSSLARHLETSPLALFRWLLAKMTATASGSSGGVVGFGARSAGESGAAPSTASRFFAQHHGHHEQQQEEEEEEGNGLEQEEGAGENHDASHHPLMAQGGWGAAGIGAGGGERRERSFSLPGGGGGSGGVGGRSGGQQEKPTLPRVLCYPVALERGVVDVTPRLVSYFEVTIMTPRVDPPHAIPDCIAVGVSEERFPLKGKMPGWDACSYGYHSDDGGAFHDAGSMLFKCGPSFGPGDVVGCGLDYSVGDDRADIFFTLNGESLPNNNNNNGDDGDGDDDGREGGVGFAAFRGVRGTFYPTVGVDSACPVRINLGRKPFRFDLAAALRRGGQEVTARESVARHDPQHRRPRPRAPSVAGAPSASAAAAAGMEPSASPSPSSSFSKRPSHPQFSMPRQSRQRSLPLSLPLPLPVPALFLPANGSSTGSSSSENPDSDLALSH